MYERKSLAHASVFVWCLLVLISLWLMLVHIVLPTLYTDLTYVRSIVQVFPVYVYVGADCILLICSLLGLRLFANRNSLDDFIAGCLAVLVGLTSMTSLFNQFFLHLH